MHRDIAGINVAFVVAGLLPEAVRAATELVNITVDDLIPDPRTGMSIAYTPAGDWTTGQNCSHCRAQPDPSKTHNNSWHDTTYDPQKSPDELPGNATFNFTGSAIYVYGILCRKSQSFTSALDLSFFIDGQQQGNLSYEPGTGGEKAFMYNATLFSIDTLPYKEHSLVIQNGRKGAQASLLLLDYLVYTIQKNTSSDAPSTIASTLTTVTLSQSSTLTSGKAPPAAHTNANAIYSTIIGIAITFGTLLGVLGVVVAYCVIRRRQRAENSTLRLKVFRRRSADATESVALSDPRAHPIMQKKDRVQSEYSGVGIDGSLRIGRSYGKEEAPYTWRTYRKLEIPA